MTVFFIVVYNLQTLSNISIAKRNATLLVLENVGKKLFNVLFFYVMKNIDTNSLLQFLPAELFCCCFDSYFSVFTNNDNSMGLLISALWCKFKCCYLIVSTMSH